LLARGWRNLDAWAGADRIRRGRVVFFGEHGQIAAHGAGPDPRLAQARARGASRAGGALRAAHPAIETEMRPL
jgi:hypothetical protein